MLTFFALVCTVSKWKLMAIDYSSLYVPLFRLPILYHMLITSSVGFVSWSFLQKLNEDKVWSIGRATSIYFLCPFVITGSVATRRHEILSRTSVVIVILIFIIITFSCSCCSLPSSTRVFLGRPNQWCHWDTFKQLRSSETDWTSLSYFGFWNEITPTLLKNTRNHH